MAYRVSQPLAASPIIDPDEYETVAERRKRRRERYEKIQQKKRLAAAKNAPKMPTRRATKIESKGPKTLATRTKPKKKRTVVKYTDKDGSKVKSVERRSGKLIETRKKRGGKYSTYKSKKITDKKGNVRVKTKYSY